MYQRSCKTLHGSLSLHALLTQPFLYTERLKTSNTNKAKIIIFFICLPSLWTLAFFFTQVGYEKLSSLNPCPIPIFISFSAHFSSLYSFHSNFYLPKCHMGSCVLLLLAFVVVVFFFPSDNPFTRRKCYI